MTDNPEEVFEYLSIKDKPDLQQEYQQQDQEILNYIQENPLVKQHIEEKIGKHIEEIFKYLMDKNN